MTNKRTMMEKSENTFEISVGGEFMDKPLTIRPEETTDGVPIYHCYVAGTTVSQLRREPSGEWIQLWGSLPTDVVHHIGQAITEKSG